MGQKNIETKHLALVKARGVTGGREPGRKGGGRGTGGGREKGGKWEFKAKIGRCGTEMQNATLFHLVCIRIPKVQEHEMIFDLH